jgi:hypothetical protein
MQAYARNVKDVKCQYIESIAFSFAHFVSVRAYALSPDDDVVGGNECQIF